MNRSLTTLLLLGLSTTCLARETYDNVEDQGRPVIGQQKMEEEPSSTTIGGTRSGQLEAEKERDDLRGKKAQKKQSLYEYNGFYRRGL